MPDANPSTGIIDRVRQASGQNRVSLTQTLRVQYGKENTAAQMGDEGAADTGSWPEWLARKGYMLGKDGLVQAGSS